MNVIVNRSQYYSHLLAKFRNSKIVTAWILKGLNVCGYVDLYPTFKEVVGLARK